MKWNSMILATAIGLILSPDVLALEYEKVSIHASACVQADDSAGVINRSDYRITNRGSVAADVFCPITSNMYGIIGFGIRVSVRVADYHSAENVTCTLSMRNKDGYSIASDSKSSIGSGTQDLNLELDPSSWDAESDSYYPAAVSLRCTLPPNTSQGYTKIFHYTASTTNPW